jgi:hypothetical protein
MKRVSKMNPNVAGIAAPIEGITVVETEVHGKCLMRFVPSVELKPRFRSGPLMVGRYFVWSVFKNNVK